MAVGLVVVSSADDPAVDRPLRSGDRRRFDPSRSVLSLHDDGHWYAGLQTDWLRWPDGEWHAHVTYTVAPGSTYLRSVTAELVRLPPATDRL